MALDPVPERVTEVDALLVGEPELLCELVDTLLCQDVPFVELRMKNRDAGATGPDNGPLSSHGFTVRSNRIRHSTVASPHRRSGIGRSPTCHRPPGQPSADLVEAVREHRAPQGPAERSPGHRHVQAVHPVTEPGAAPGAGPDSQPIPRRAGLHAQAHEVGRTTTTATDHTRADRSGASGRRRRYLRRRRAPPMGRPRPHRRWSHRRGSHRRWSGRRPPPPRARPRPRRRPGPRARPPPRRPRPRR